MAIENTKTLLIDKNNYRLFKMSREYILDCLNEYNDKISLIIFNLGYLPGSDKTITTNADSTIKAIKDSFTLLNGKGRILIVLYSGHEEGFRELKAINKLINGLNYNEYHNTDNKKLLI